MSSILVPRTSPLPYNQAISLTKKLFADRMVTPTARIILNDFLETNLENLNIYSEGQRVLKTVLKGVFDTIKIRSLVNKDPGSYLAKTFKKKPLYLAAILRFYDTKEKEFLQEELDYHNIKFHIKYYYDAFQEFPWKIDQEIKENPKNKSKLIKTNSPIKEIRVNGEKNLIKLKVLGSCHDYAW